MLRYLDNRTGSLTAGAGLTMSCFEGHRAHIHVTDCSMLHAEVVVIESCIERSLSSHLRARFRSRKQNDDSGADG